MITVTQSSWKSNQIQLARGKCLVLYDSECSACTNFRKSVEFLDPRKRLTFVRLSDASKVGVNMPRDLLYRSFHFLDSKGDIASGWEAIPQLLEGLPIVSILSKTVLRVPLGQRLVRFAYTTLSRLHETGACTSRKKY